MQSIFNTPEDRLFMIGLLLHCADISNPLKPLAISDKYVTRHQPQEHLHHADMPVRMAHDLPGLCPGTSKHAVHATRMASDSPLFEAPGMNSSTNVFILVVLTPSHHSLSHL